MDTACYRKIKKLWKYQLVEDFDIDTSIQVSPPVDKTFYRLDSGGVLLIRKGYAWDGASGPAIDTLNWMRASLVHDCLYQMIRLKQISADHKDAADKLMKHILEIDGMSRFRRWYSHVGVSLFGYFASRPRGQRPDKITCVARGGQGTTTGG